MRFRILLPLVTTLLPVGTGHCAAQETAEFPDAELTREEWQQRVEAARRRSQDFIANLRTQTPASPSPDQVEHEATDRAMNDPALRPGDIISTGRGLMMFIGKSEEHQPSDFRPLPP